MRGSGTARAARSTSFSPRRLPGHSIWGSSSSPDIRDAFFEYGVLIAPWEVAELVVITAARHGPILHHVWVEERKAQHEAIHGHYLSMGRGEDLYVDPERSVEFDVEYKRPRREILRSWCGRQAVERFDEIVELRQGDSARRKMSRSGLLTRCTPLGRVRRRRSCSVT